MEQESQPSTPGSSENPEGTCALCRVYAPSQVDRVPDTELMACAACRDRMQRYPLPPWVRNFYAIVALFVISGTIYNARFVSGYWDLTRAKAALDRADLDMAVQRFASASSHVPEARQLEGFHQMFRGFLLLREEREIEAEQALHAAHSILPNNAALEQAMSAASVGAAFDRKDYDTLLKLAQERLGKSRDQSSLFQVASAFACKFAMTGDESYRNAAMTHLEQGLVIKTPGEEHAAAEFEQRIRHRLSTREIITPREFHQRYPNGWRE